jgi:phage terminase large subunit-like protein
MIPSLYRPRIVHRKAGEALPSEREPLALLKQLQRTLGTYNFSGQYQQSPVPLGGGMVKAQWFKYYVPGEEASRFDLIFQSRHTANKCTELSDFGVYQLGMQEKKTHPTPHAVPTFRVSTVETGGAASGATPSAEQPSNLLIEDKASGAQLMEDLRQGGMYGVTPYAPGGRDKIMRLNSVTSTIESGYLYLRKDAEWLAHYLRELTSFPAGKHGDQTDSTSQALDWIKYGKISVIGEPIRSFRSVVHASRLRQAGKSNIAFPYCEIRSGG